MNIRAIKQNMLLILLGILIALFISEIGLWLRKMVYLSGKVHRNRISLSKKADYLILCLGESTTAEGGWYSYPRQMEKILTERLSPLQFTVINKGAPGEDTNFILSNLEENLEKYKPDMVIVMMGINDKMVANAKTFGRLRNKNIFLVAKDFIKQLKVTKIVRLSLMRIHEKEVLKKLYFDRARYFQEKNNFLMVERLFKKLIALDPKDPDAYLEFARYYSEINNYPQADAMFEQALNLFTRNEAVLGEAALYYCERENFKRAQELYEQIIRLNRANVLAYISLGQTYYAQGKIETAEGLFSQAIKMRQKEEQVFIEIGQFYQAQNEYLKAKRIFNSLLELNPGNASAYIGLGNCYYSEGNFSESEKMLKKAFEIDPKGEDNCEQLGNYYQKRQQPSEADKIYEQFISKVKGTDNYDLQTLQNYKKLRKEVLKRRTKLVCVQYPRRALLPLKRIFDSNKGIVFVDNERLFKDAIKNGTFEDYFYDRFAGDFGHCTVEGNRLLAGNVAETIIKEIFSKEK